METMRWAFSIHDCVDGFSHRLMWLSVVTTNNDRLVIANYFPDTVAQQAQNNSINSTNGSWN